MRVLRVGSVGAGSLSSLSGLGRLSLRVRLSACLVDFLHFFSPNLLRRKFLEFEIYY